MASPDGPSLFRRPLAYVTAFQRRSEELENIDRGDYTAEEYEGCMVELRRVNRFMGDSAILRRWLTREAESASLKDFSVLDVGAGTGELLRVVARWARKSRRKTRLVGLELNARSAAGILEESREYSEITAVRGDALTLPFRSGSFDFVICSLFTHHLKDEEVVTALQEFGRVARRRVFVIDLHRHPLAYLLYTTVGRLVLYNRLLREDGALSILKSFRPAELRQLAIRSQVKGVCVVRRFPFRLVLTASGSK
jgi:ubiquinone/menaquinone biosynthesis C-methylase UbiE